MKISKSIAALSTLLILSGCNQTNVRSAEENKARTVQTKPDLYTLSKNDVIGSDLAVDLPQNYDPSNFKKFKVAVSFFPQDGANADKFAKEKSETVSSLFETEISKLKRFTILSRSQLGQQAVAAEKAFQDTGMVSSNESLRLGNWKGADYALTGGIVITSEKYERVKNQEMIFYVKVNYQLIDNTSGEILEADTAEGRSKRSFYQTPGGTYIGGFDINDPQQAKNAVNEAAFGALKVIASKLGNKLPVGGQVIGLKGDRFQLDSGHEQGLMGNQVMVLYTWDGVDVPLAYAEVNPGRDKSSGKIFKWNSDAEATDLIEAMRSGGMSFLREYDVYAVTRAMPTPPEWDKNFSN